LPEGDETQHHRGGDDDLETGSALELRGHPRVLAGLRPFAGIAPRYTRSATNSLRRANCQHRTVGLADYLGCFGPCRFTLCGFLDVV
jgi:hypothetical protein